MWVVRKRLGGRLRAVEVCEAGRRIVRPLRPRVLVILDGDHRVQLVALAGPLGRVRALVGFGRPLFCHTPLQLLTSDSVGTRNRHQKPSATIPK